MKTAIRVGLAAVLCILFASLSWGANIVVNPGFEDGNFNGWTMQGVQGATVALPQGAYNNVVSESGPTPWFVALDDYGVQLGDGGINDLTGVQEFASLFQTWGSLDTGATYVLTYYFENVLVPDNHPPPPDPPDPDDPGPIPDNEFEIWWNGSRIFNVTNAPYALYPPAGTPFILPLPVADGTSNTLEFRFWNHTDEFGLDQVCIDNVPGDPCGAGDNGEIPEPSTLALVSLPLIGLALVRRRK